MGYGRFNGGSHFNYLKKVKIQTKKTAKVMVTLEQREILKELGLSFQENSMTEESASKLIEKIKKGKAKS